jgi:hypothetical protein
MKLQSQHIFYSFMAAISLFLLCIAIQPAGLAANDGLSYYGSAWSTLLPFAAAMLLYEYTLWHTSTRLAQNRRYHFLAISLKLIAILLIGVLITPIRYMENFHSFIGLILFIVQFGLSIKLLSWGFHWLDAGLVAVEALGFMAALYYANFEHGLLLQSQVIFQMAFMILLVRVLSLLRKHRSSPNRSKRP